MSRARHGWIGCVLLVLSLVAAQLACAPAGAPDANAPETANEQVQDRLAPKSSGEDAPTRQLYAATLSTADIEAVRSFFVGGLGMSIDGPMAVDEATKATQRALWGIPDDVDWELYVLDRPSAPGTVKIRVLSLDRETAPIHESWDPREVGPLSLGFPTEDLETWDAELRKRGFESINPLSKYELPRPDGTMYGIHETIFNAPEFLHAVTISRRDGMPQLGPVDPESGRGGPVYSALIVENSDEVISFYVDLLGFEARMDRVATSSGSDGALGVPDGTKFRFVILYAQGARFGHLLILDYEGDTAIPGGGVPWRPPHRGLGGWTFPVKDIDATFRALEAAGAEIVHEPVEVESPTYGKARAMTVLDPNELLVELFEPIP